MFDSLLLILIKGYQVSLSTFFGGHCRFHPSCSKYAEEAIKTHGAWRGVPLTLSRVSKCHPLSSQRGYDPVPPGKL